MRRKSKASLVALCGVFAALATVLLFLGGVLPFAVIACPVVASLVLIPVYTETGWKWGLVWYLAVSALGLILAPDKEAPILFLFLGYYPVLRRLINRLPFRPLRGTVKLVYFNLSIAAAYGLMIFVFRMGAVTEEFASMERYLLIACIVLANLSFAVYDRLIDRLEIFYHVRIRPKLNL